jgi:hypothetical protein
MPWPAPVTIATFPASMSTIVPSFRERLSRSIPTVSI